MVRVDLLTQVRCWQGEARAIKRAGSPSRSASGPGRASGVVVTFRGCWHAMGMAHAATSKAKRREADRLRKRRERAERKELGMPEPHQVDLAVTEAMSYVLALSLPAGADRLPQDASVSVRQVVQVAMGILVKRWRFNKAHAARALQARIGKRSEHSNVSWFPHFPSAEPKFWADMSKAEGADPPVTPSGRVRNGGDQVTQI